MEAPVLTLLDQKKSLSAKKKKKVIKNVLGLPNSVKLNSIEINNEDGKKLTAILERLLPGARIPRQENSKRGVDERKVDKTPVELELINQAKNNRSQLALGVNELNRSIKKNLISATLLASDVSPKFLISHLILLCKNNDIPFLSIPDLRQITQNCLGFPCIALGFRKSSNYFSEAVLEIQTTAICKLESKQNTTSSSSSDSEEEICNESSNKLGNEVPFKFLYRTSATERVFIPEMNKNADNNIKKLEGDFISLTESKDIKLTRNNSDNNYNVGISVNVIAKQKKKIQTPKFYLTENDNEQNVPAKKQKISWSSNKKGQKSSIEYFPPNVVKLQSNENRRKKNK